MISRLKSRVARADSASSGIRTNREDVSWHARFFGLFSQQTFSCIAVKLQYYFWKLQSFCVRAWTVEIMLPLQSTILDQFHINYLAVCLFHQICNFNYIPLLVYIIDRCSIFSRSRLVQVNTLLNLLQQT